MTKQEAINLLYYYRVSVADMILDMGRAMRNDTGYDNLWLRIRYIRILLAAAQIEIRKQDPDLVYLRNNFNYIYYLLGTYLRKGSIPAIDYEIISPGSPLGPVMPIEGNDGWSPMLANIQTGPERVVQQVFSWIGGDGDMPPFGLYIGQDGFTPNENEATNIMGPGSATIDEDFLPVNRSIIQLGPVYSDPIDNINGSGSFYQSVDTPDRPNTGNSGGMYLGRSQQDGNIVPAIFVGSSTDEQDEFFWRGRVNQPWFQGASRQWISTQLSALDLQAVTDNGNIANNVIQVNGSNNIISSGEHLVMGYQESTTEGFIGTIRDGVLLSRVVFQGDSGIGSQNSIAFTVESPTPSFIINGLGDNPIAIFAGSVQGQPATADNQFIVRGQLGDYQLLSEKGQPDGYPNLDGSGRVPIDQMPIEVVHLLGNWDASTNTPTLADGTGTQGDAYQVTVAGIQDLGSGPIDFEVDDLVIYNGSTWFKSSGLQYQNLSFLNGQLSISNGNSINLDSRYVPSGGNVSLFNNDAGYITSADIPAAQTLTFDTDTGSLSISDGNDVSINSLSRQNKNATDPLTGEPVLYPLYWNNTNTGWPFSLGIGLRAQRHQSGTNYNAGFDIFIGSGAAQTLSWREKISGDDTSWGPVQTFASQEWADTTFYTRVLSDGRYASLLPDFNNRQGTATDIDLNTILNNSMVRFNSGSTNKPSFFSSGGSLVSVMNEAGGDILGAQIAIDDVNIDSDAFSFRNIRAGIYGSWFRMASREWSNQQFLGFDPTINNRKATIGGIDVDTVRNSSVIRHSNTATNQPGAGSAGILMSLVQESITGENGIQIWSSTSQDSLWFRGMTSQVYLPWYRVASRTWIENNFYTQAQSDARYELLVNKATDFSTVNNTLYPSVQAVRNWVNSFGIGDQISGSEIVALADATSGGLFRFSSTDPDKPPEFEPLVGGLYVNIVVDSTPVDGLVQLAMTYESDSGFSYIGYRGGDSTGNYSDWLRLAERNWSDNRFLGFDPAINNRQATISGGDLNTILNQSSIRYAVSTTNAPTVEAGIALTLIHNGPTLVSGVQIGIDTGANDSFWYRRTAAGVYQPWFQLASRDWVTANFGGAAQTLTFTSGNGDLSISGGNTVNLDSRYLTIGTPQTIIGQKIFEGTNPIRLAGLGIGATNQVFIPFTESDGNTRQGYIGFGSTLSSDLYIRNDVANAQLRIVETGGINGLVYSNGTQNNTVWHSGNFNPSEGLRQIPVTVTFAATDPQTSTAGTNTVSVSDVVPGFDYVLVMQSGGTMSTDLLYIANVTASNTVSVRRYNIGTAQAPAITDQTLILYVLHAF